MQSIPTQSFVDLIATTLGLRIRKQDEVALGHKLLQRVKLLGLPSLEAYYQLLVATQASVVSNAEWRKLIDMLTVNESYLFRDQGQFALLKNRILPDLIQAKQNLTDSYKTIRVWSAGCSTGEEAYSLAILLKELIPAEQHWNLVVLGTDANESALAQAKQGIYSDWSFRSVNPAIQSKYFRSHRHGWEVNPDIRSIVNFQLGNLVQDVYPSIQSQIYHLDLIVCRNVFIYFNADAIASVLGRFYQALAPNGFLITGHTELYGQNLNPFQIKTFPESVVYQRLGVPLQTVSSVSKTQTSSVQAVLSPKKDLVFEIKPLEPEPPQQNPIALSDITTLIQSKAYEQAIETARQYIIQSPHCVQAHCLIAEAHANLGNYSSAIESCQQAIQLNPFAVEPLYLLAQISQEQGDLEAARNLLRRVIYLAPTSVYAYFELGCLYEQEGNLAKASRNWRSALDSLKQIAPNTSIDAYRHLTAADLQFMVEQKLIPKH